MTTDWKLDQARSELMAHGTAFIRPAVWCFFQSFLALVILSVLSTTTNSHVALIKHSQTPVSSCCFLVSHSAKHPGLRRLNKTANINTVCLVSLFASSHSGIYIVLITIHTQTAGFLKDLESAAEELRRVPFLALKLTFFFLFQLR